MKKILPVIMIFVFSTPMVSQNCASADNIYSFIYNNKSYEIVKENKTWTNAALCAVERGGYLAEINDEDEQDNLYHHAKNIAGIDPSNTIAPDGGGASYIWLGGNDIAEEGKWIWDGNNDGEGPQFWQGTTSGGPVGGLYNNWGNEPDNWNNQDGLGLAITDWPLGSSGQWNDVDDNNALYFIIEHDIVLGMNEDEIEDFYIHPNPAEHYIDIVTNSTGNNIRSVSVINTSGQVLVNRSINGADDARVPVSDFDSGLYFVSVNTDKSTTIQKFVKR